MKKVTILDKSTLAGHLSATREAENSQFSSNSSGESTMNEKEKIKDYSGSTAVSFEPVSPLTTFNPQLIARSSSSTGGPHSTRLGVVPNAFTAHRRHMYSKAADRAVAINDRIERMARKWTASESSPVTYEELAHPGRASQESIITVGRIVCDSNAKLNEESVLLESSRSIGSGARVPLNLSSVPNFSLFPGQIVTVEGVNADGKCLHVTRFLQPGNALMKIPKIPEAYGQYESFADSVMAVVVAAGPFTLDSRPDLKELDYSPLEALLKVVAQKRPEVLVLCGPFIDSDNSALQSGNLHYLPDQIFHLEISLRLAELREICPETRVVLVPSLKDVHSSVDYVYPQPALQNLKNEGANVTTVSNPSMFFVNEICFSVSNNDILMPLAQQSIARGSADRMSRISNHLLEQASLYPLMPAAHGSNLDYSLLDQIELPFTPDVLISPSSLGAFARSIDSDSVCLNPGLFCRKAALGTAALLSFNKPKSTDNSVDSVAQRLRVDFIQF